MRRNDKNSTEARFDDKETKNCQLNSAESISALVANLEASLSLYKAENGKLKEQLEEFRESNYILRKENIQLRIKLSNLENSKELKASLEHINDQNIAKTPEKREVEIAPIILEVPDTGKIMPRRTRKSATIKINSNNERTHRPPRELSPKTSQSHIGIEIKEYIKTHRENKKSSKRHSSSKYMPSFMRHPKS